MKRDASRSFKALLAVFSTLTSSLLLETLPVSALSVGSNQCVQSVDTSTDVVVFQDSGSCYIAFKGNRTYSWTPPVSITDIDLLIVGGGGGGGARHAGGGGAGGLINLTTLPIDSSALSISVGAGGAGGAAVNSVSGGDRGSEGSNGSSSQVSGGGISTQIAFGGGGGSWALTSGSGASSGGGGCCGQSRGTTIVGQGNTGGAGFTNGAIWAAGGGGGFAASGDGATSSGSGRGGAGGSISWISGAAQGALGVGEIVNSKVYFSGGGGGSTTTGTAGVGGVGGGGSGVNNTSAGFSGAAFTGGGGGGGGINGSGASKGGDGGSGVVVIRYSIPVAYFIADSYTAGATTWPNIISGGTAGTTSSGGMAKVVSGPAGVIFAGRESSNSDQVTSTIGSTSSLDTVTVEMWIRLKDSGNAQNTNGSMLFSWNSGNYNVYHYGNQVGFNNFNSQLYGIESTSYNNIWTHFVFQMTDVGSWDTQKIYVNGVLQNSTCRVTPANCTVGSARVFDSTGSFRLMDNPYSANAWNAKGDIGLVRVYNNQLSAAQIYENYSASQSNYVMPVNLVGSLTAAGSVIKGKNVTLTLATVVDGKVQFLASGKRIPGCISRATSGSYPNFSATCNWKPANSGNASVTAKLTPNDPSFSISVSNPLNIYVLRRSDKR